MKYSEAVKKAVNEQLLSAESLYVFGQDLVRWGGYGGVFRGLPEKFPQNFFDTPIAEAAATGVAAGMALTGKPALVEYAFFDFILHAADQIINNASKLSFFSNNKISLPITLYATLGSNRKYGATHSQSLEYIFSNVPGLEVLFPSNATDAYQMLKGCFASRSPNLFVVHRLLLDSEFNPSQISEKKARIVVEGGDLTVIAYGRAVELVRQIIDEFNLKDIELIDLRYLTSIDYDTLLQSIAKTGRVLVVEEGYGAISKKLIGELVLMIDQRDVKFHSLTSAFESIGISNEKDVLIKSSAIINKIRSLVE